MMKLPNLVRLAREAQGLSQAELAKEMGVSQSALAQYENQKTSLSPERISEVAPFLNLSRKFIETGFGNPFKPATQGTLIKFLLPVAGVEEVDYSLLEIIAEGNRSAFFLLLRPPMIPGGYRSEISDEIRKDILSFNRQRRQGRSGIAILVRDEESNYILLKRKDNLLFNEESVFEFLRSIESDKKLFEYDINGLSHSEYKRIKDWEDLDCSFAIDLINSKLSDDRFFLQRLIKEIWSYGNVEGDKSKIEDIIKRMDEGDLKKIKSFLIPEILKTIENFLMIHQR